MEESRLKKHGKNFASTKTSNKERKGKRREEKFSLKKKQHFVKNSKRKSHRKYGFAK